MDTESVIEISSLKRKFMFLAGFLAITPFVILVSLISLVRITNEKKIDSVAINNSPQKTQIFASLPRAYPEIAPEVQAGDARPLIIKKYLEEYKSPLSPHAQFIVDTADKYGLDFRLITAIAQQESNLCKFIPPETYNCWGWGIHSRGTLGFTSYEEAIDVVTRGIKQEYVDKGLTTPEAIMAKYTPSSNGSWAHGVGTFLAEME